MATKLDLTIAGIAKAYGHGSRQDLVNAARTGVGKVSDKDLAKLPERADCKVTAKAAGVPDLDDSWHRYWFEALVELLVQSGARGVPGLFLLWERESFTHPKFVLPALIRSALAGYEAEEIERRIRDRLRTLNYPFVRTGVMESFHWASVEPGIKSYLERFGDVPVVNGDGETVGTFLHRFTHVEPL